MRDYSDCYATLGITPDTDWKVLRARYRQLIGQWHPDRFSGDATGKTIAEERSKEITLAYQTLERYRRDYGTLPPLEPAAAAPEPSAQATAFERHVDAGTAPAEPEAAAGVPKRRSRRLRRVVYFLAVLFAAVYAFDRYLGEPEPGDTAPVAEATPEPEPAPQRAPLAEDSQAPGGIRVGSTLGEVYAIQGVPTSTQEDTWHYGKSLIRFEKGKVVSWEEHVDNPLRIDRHRVTLLHERLFGVGSTKDEVRAIQGAPITDTGNVWYYGRSKVYFEHGLVVHWEESPLQPLRVAR